MHPSPERFLLKETCLNDEHNLQVLRDSTQVSSSTAEIPKPVPPASKHFK